MVSGFQARSYEAKDLTTERTITRRGEPVGAELNLGSSAVSKPKTLQSSRRSAKRTTQPANLSRSACGDRVRIVLRFRAAADSPARRLASHNRATLDRPRRARLGRQKSSTPRVPRYSGDRWPLGAARLPGFAQSTTGLRSR